MGWRTNKRGDHYNTDKQIRDVGSDDDTNIEVVINAGDAEELEQFAKEKAESVEDSEEMEDEDSETNTMTMKEFLDYGDYLEDEVKRRAEKHHSHFFDKDTMRFFSSRVSELMWVDGDRKDYQTNPIYFITSEQDRGPYQHSGSVRAFTIRRIDADGDIDTIGDFQGYSTLNEARRAIKEMLVVN